MSERNETYLGDGLYAFFDGFMLTLRAPRMGGDHFVCLEREVFAAMLKFMEQQRPTNPSAAGTAQSEDSTDD